MRLKYLQLNIWRGGELFDALLEFLKSEKVDIMALQEVYDGKNPQLPNKFQTMEILKNEFKDHFFSFSPTWSDNRSNGKFEVGNAVFSKFPIVSSKTVFYKEKYREVTEEADFANKNNYKIFITYPRNLQMVEIRLGQVNVNVFNTHGVWGFDAEDSERRLEMSKTIIKQLKGKENVILSGDFNVKENTKTIGNIEKLLKNVFKGELQTTFNTRQMQKKNIVNFIPQVVDFVFVSEDLKAVQHYSPEADVSDHVPLV